MSIDGLNFFIIHSSAVVPQVEPYNFTELAAFNDRDLGALIVRQNGTSLMFSVHVIADPCPYITWSFNGTRLELSNEMISYNNSCIEDSTRSPNWIFTLNVVLTAATSGNYSAYFTNIAGTTVLPMTYFTIPGMS